MERSGPENRMSGSGAGAGLEKLRWCGNGAGAGGRESGNGAVSGLNRPLTIRSNLLPVLIDIVSYHTSAFGSQFPNFEIEHILLCRLCKFVEYFPAYNCRVARTHSRYWKLIKFNMRLCHFGHIQ